MDRSTKYVLMCNKSLPLRNLKPYMDSFKLWRLGTILISEDGDFLADVASSDIRRRTESIWTPRIDQLVDLLGGYNKTSNIIYWWEETYSIIDQVKGAYWGYNSSDFDSFEQLLLAVYMYQQHNYVWRGEDWIIPG